MKKYIYETVVFFFVLLFTGCGSQNEVAFSGKTMGTVYHIKIVTGFFDNTEGLKHKIEMKLEDINKSMSTYRKNSEISRFNALGRIGEKFYISDDFLHVMTVAQNIYQLTDGAWDGTIKPLVNLWGFGNSKNKKRIPSKSEIQAILPDIGFNHIEIFPERYLLKKKLPYPLILPPLQRDMLLIKLQCL